MNKIVEKTEAKRIALETFLRDAPDDYPRDNLEAHAGLANAPDGKRCRSISIWFRAETSKLIHLCNYRFITLDEIIPRLENLAEVRSKIEAEEVYQSKLDAKRAARLPDPPHVTKLLSIAEAIKAEGGITEHIISDKRGHARKDGVIRAPEGRTVKQLQIIAHEVGHVVMKHNGSSAPRHVQEYEAEKYAFDALKRHGVKVPRKILKHSKQCIASMILRAGKKAAIDPRVKKFVGPAGLQWVALRFQPSYLISAERAAYAAI